MIVEKSSKIAKFVQERLAIMQPNDIALASFLHWDETANQTMAENYNYSAKEVKEDGEVVGVHFEKTLGIRILKMLRDKGIQKEDLTVVNTAFKTSTVERMIRRFGGRTLHMSIIATKTDEGALIKVIGTVFVKA